MIGLSGIGVLPSNGGSTSIGGTPNASDAFTAQLDFTYFVTPNIALNLIAATPSTMSRSAMSRAPGPSISATPASCRRR